MDTELAKRIADCGCNGCRKYLAWFEADKYVPLADDMTQTVTALLPPLPPHFDWYYQGKLLAMGRDAHGHDYEFDKANGELKRATSENERVRIAAYAKRYGVRQAADKYDVNQATVRGWMTQARKRRGQRSHGRSESSTP